MPAPAHHPSFLTGPFLAVFPFKSRVSSPHVHTPSLRSRVKLRLCVRGLISTVTLAVTGHPVPVCGCCHLLLRAMRTSAPLLLAVVSPGVRQLAAPRPSAGLSDFSACSRFSGPCLQPVTTRLAAQTSFYDVSFCGAGVVGTTERVLCSRSHQAAVTRRLGRVLIHGPGWGGRGSPELPQCRQNSSVTTGPGSLFSAGWQPGATPRSWRSPCPVYSPNPHTCTCLCDNSPSAPCSEVTRTEGLCVPRQDVRCGHVGSCGRLWFQL